MVGLKPEPELRRGFKDKNRLAMVGSYSCMICGKEANVHHLAGIGAGKKASDLLTAAICNDCHTGKEGIHNIALWKWEDQNMSQDELIRLTDKALEKIS